MFAANLVADVISWALELPVQRRSYYAFNGMRYDYYVSTGEPFSNHATIALLIVILIAFIVFIRGVMATPMPAPLHCRRRSVY